MMEKVGITKKYFLFGLSFAILVSLTIEYFLFFNNPIRIISLDEKIKGIFALLFIFIPPISYLFGSSGYLISNWKKINTSERIFKILFTIIIPMLLFITMTLFLIIVSNMI